MCSIKENLTARDDTWIDNLNRGLLIELFTVPYYGFPDYFSGNGALVGTASQEGFNSRNIDYLSVLQIYRTEKLPTVIELVRRVSMFSINRVIHTLHCVRQQRSPVFLVSINVAP